MLAATAAALFTVACQKPDNTNGGGTGELTPGLKEAVYRGEKPTGKAGIALYSIELADKNNPATTLRIALFSDVAVSDNISPAAGTYELGTKEDPKLSTFVVATSAATDDFGSIYYDNGTPVLLKEGTVNIRKSTGIQQVIANFKTETGETIEWDFKGSITYKDEREDLPRQEITATMWDATYEGEYPYANGLGMVYLSMAPTDMSSVLTLAFTIPMPEDPNKVSLPEGTFSVETRPSEANKLIEGAIEMPNILYTREITFNTTTTTMTGGVLAEGGTATVTKNEDGTYNISAELNGKSFNQSGTIIGNVDGIKYTLTNAEFPEFIDNKTQPMSTLEEDVTLTEPMEYFYVDPLDNAWLIQGSTNRIMWRFIFSNGVQMINDNADYEKYGTLYIRGEKGSALSIQLISEAPSDLNKITIPTGTFPMNDKYLNLSVDYSNDLVAQTTVSGNPDLSDPFGLGVGTFYFIIDQVDNGSGQTVTSVVDGGGAVINKGQTTVTAKGDDTYEVTFEYFDKYDHKISGTQTFKMSSAAAAQAVVKGTLTQAGYLYNPTLEAFSNSPFASFPSVYSLK